MSGVTNNLTVDAQLWSRTVLISAQRMSADGVADASVTLDVEAARALGALASLVQETPSLLSSLARLGEAADIIEWDGGLRAGDAA